MPCSATLNADLLNPDFFEAAGATGKDEHDYLESIFFMNTARSVRLNFIKKCDQGLTRVFNWYMDFSLKQILR